MFAWNEVEVTVSTTYPTEVAVSLTLVVQSPWAGLLVPKATLTPVPEAVAVADGELPEQAETRSTAASSTAEAARQGGDGNRTDAIFRRRVRRQLGALVTQRLRTFVPFRPSHVRLQIDMESDFGKA